MLLVIGEWVGGREGESKERKRGRRKLQVGTCTCRKGEKKRRKAGFQIVKGGGAKVEG